MASSELSETESYRVVMLGRSAGEVLLIPHGEKFMLPSVDISRWQRVAENLAAVFKTDWSMEVVCLFELQTQSVDRPASTRYHAAEHMSTCGNPKMPTRWIPVSALHQDSLTEACDFAAIKQLLGVCSGPSEGVDAGPFACPGWFRKLRTWIESVIEPMGFHFTGKFRQLNASPSFSLIRLETDGPALWFKAVGEPNRREYAITSTLAQFFPDYLPPLLASRPDWNGWLSTEVRGELLSECEEQAPWEQTATALARLQIQSINRGSQILAAGARDLGWAALSKLIRPFMEVIAHLMESQIKISPPVLDREDLRLLADCLENSINAMEDAGIPETLGHLDLNPGNVIVSENQCAFLDWAEAYVGSPLFSLQYLLQHARRAFAANPSIEISLIQFYCTQWRGVVSSVAIAHALTLTPFLAVFAYAAGNDAWKQLLERQDAATAGYLRSLARRMHREANALANRGLTCWA